MDKQDETESNLRMARVCVNIYFMAMEGCADTKSVAELKDAAEYLRKAVWWLDQINTIGEKNNV